MDYVKIAKQRARRLKKAGIENNALKAYEAMMNVAKRGHSKKVADKIVKKISKQFVKNELSTKTGIKARYKRQVGKTAKDIKEASEVVDVSVKLNDETLRENLGSEVLHKVYQNQEAKGYSTTMTRNALSRYFLKHAGEEFNVEEATDEIIEDIKKRLGSDYGDEE